MKKASHFSSPNPKLGIMADVSLVSVREGALDGKTHRSSNGQSPRAFNSDSLQRSSGSGDQAIRLDYKPERIVDLEQTVDKLKSTSESLKGDNPNKKTTGCKFEHSRSNHNTLNQKSVDKPHESVNSPISDLDSKKLNQLHSEICKWEGKSPEEKCVLLLNEKWHLEKKLRKTEDYSKECAFELKTLLQKYEDLKAFNKTLNKQNKKLAMENSRLMDALQAEGCDGRLSAQLELANKQRAQLNLEKGHLEGRVATLSNEVFHLMEKLEISGANRQEPLRSTMEGLSKDSSPPVRGHQEACLLDSLGNEQESHVAMIQLKEENKNLRKELEDNAKYVNDMEGSAKRWREEQGLLENCLVTVQMEKDLLQEEVRRLHQEYIELSDSISLQLREGCSVSTKMAERTSENKARDKSLRQSLHSKPITREMLDSRVGGETIAKIRKCLEEEEQRGVQRYKNTISQNE